MQNTAIKAEIEGEIGGTGSRTATIAQSHRLTHSLAHWSMEIQRFLSGTETMTALKTPVARDRLLADGVERGSIPPANRGVKVKAEIAQWAEVIPAAGIKPE